MRALLLYSLAGLIWAIVSRHNALALHDPLFWRDVAGWPVLVLLEVVDMWLAVPQYVQDKAALGFAIAALVYVGLKLDFRRRDEDDAQGRRRRRSV